MISWLQINLQKHFRAVFIVLLVVIVVAFVFTIGNQGSFGGADRGSSADLAFFEVSLDTRAKQEFFMRRQPSLYAMLSGSRQPPNPYIEAAALHVANVNKIPEPSGEELEAFIKSRPIFMDQTGNFNPNTYSMLVDNLKLSVGYSEGAMLQAIKDLYRIEKVRDALGGASGVDKSEILESLRDSQTKWSVLAATYDLANYNPEIEVTTEILQQYFEANKERYRTPVRRSVNYVEFDVSSFLGKVTPTDEQLIAYFDANSDNYKPKPEEPAEGEEAKPVEPVTFEMARPQVREDYRIAKARDLALEKANDLVIDLVNADVANKSEAFEAIIKQFGAELKKTPDFASNERPIGTTWSQQAVREAFLLSPERYYSDPFLSGDKAVVMFLGEEIGSIIPGFDTLLSTLAADYKAQELSKRRAAYAKELRSGLAESATSEEAFGAAAEQAGFTITPYSDFTPRQPAKDMNRSLLGALQGLEKGEVSDIVRVGDPNKIAVVYALSKEVPEVTEDSPEYQQMATYYAQASANAIAQAYLIRLAAAESVRTGIDIGLN